MKTNAWFYAYFEHNAFQFALNRAKSLNIYWNEVSTIVTLRAQFWVSEIWHPQGREGYCLLRYDALYSPTFLWHILFPSSRSIMTPRKKTIRHTAEGNALHIMVFLLIALIIGQDTTYSVREGSWPYMCLIQLFILCPSYEVEFFTYLDWCELCELISPEG
jgi:hypothetical protein